MRLPKPPLVLLLPLLLSMSLTALGQSTKREEALKVTLCQLTGDPAAYNQKLVEVTGFISFSYEDFTIFDPECLSWPDVWLTYGGMQTSGETRAAGRPRSEPLVVENIPINFVKDARFKQFQRVLEPFDRIAHATLRGRFFSGEKRTFPSGETGWRGYGLRGCCSLLAIEQVISVDPQNSRTLDYRTTPDEPEIGEVDCGYTELTEVFPIADLMKSQSKADSGDHPWAFTDPKRVASYGLASLLHTDERTIKLRQTQRTQGRIVYRWQPPGQKKSYMVVVNRPYLLSFYAKNRAKVAWVLFGAYESSCDPGNSIRRIKD